ncbi:MAG: hypothetical protein PHY93_03815 [Bacteriovorax sp.]|nr:hypothetical protein [Bacteriovorax sp.]
MSKQIVGSWIAGISTIILLMSCSQADELARIKALDRMTYTINPAIKLIGPVFRDQGDKIEKSKYASSLVALIIKEADAKAKKYLEAGDTQAYYAFLALGLTVPLHEGLYIHFRNVDGDVCNIAANNAELVKKAGPTNYKIFNQYFKNPERPYFPNCEVMNIKTGVNQMIRGGDGTDLSIMQVSIRWHFDDFLANRKYESVSQTLSYGLSLLLNGFDSVYRNVADYKCISDAGFLFEKNKINYTNLIKGIWAGKYNSGSNTQTCRFADPNSPYKNHDIGFAKNLDKILNFNGSISPDYIGEIKIEGDSANAIKEIVANLKDNKNDRKALDKIIGLQ